MPLLTQDERDELARLGALMRTKSHDRKSPELIRFNELSRLAAKDEMTERRERAKEEKHSMTAAERSEWRRQVAQNKARELAIREDNKTTREARRAAKAEAQAEDAAAKEARGVKRDAVKALQARYSRLRAELHEKYVADCRALNAAQEAEELLL